jgi:lipocalin
MARYSRLSQRVCWRVNYCGLLGHNGLYIVTDVSKDLRGFIVMAKQTKSAWLVDRGVQNLSRDTKCEVTSPEPGSIPQVSPLY